MIFSFKIPNANRIQGFTGGGVSRGTDRYCGRFFNNVDGIAGSETICSKFLYI